MDPTPLPRPYRHRLARPLYVPTGQPDPVTRELYPADPVTGEQPAIRPVPLPAPLGQGHEVVEGEVLDPPDPHGITRTEYPSGVSWVCACGQWEGFATGPSSAAWAGADHRRHVADATAEPDG